MILQQQPRDVATVVISSTASEVVVCSDHCLGGHDPDLPD